MDTKVNYAVVGAFVLLLGAAFIAVTLWLGFGERRIGYRTYIAYMTESVTGLSPNAPVRYNGVRVGRVREISLDKEDPRRVRLLLDIAPDTPVKLDSVAVLSSQGLTGLAQIDLTGGTRASALLEPAPGEAYAEIRTGPSLFLRLDKAVFSALASLDAVSQQIRTVTERVSKLLDEHNLVVVGRILDDLQSVSAALAGESETITRTIKQLDRLSDNTARASEQLPELESRLRGALDAVEQAGNTVTKASREIDEFALQARHELAAVAEETVPQFNEAVNQVRKLADTLNRLANEIERNPALLLQGRRGEQPGPGE